MRDDPWWEVHCRGPWEGLLRVHGSWGRTARMAGVAFLKDLLDDPPPALTGLPRGVISIHMPGWLGACLVLEVKVEAACIRIRRRWPIPGRWRLGCGRPPRRRHPGPTCAELAGKRLAPTANVRTRPKETLTMPTDDDLEPDFEFATNADLYRVLRGRAVEPADDTHQSDELARWADDGGPTADHE